MFRTVLDRADETKDFESSEYQAAVEVFYKRHLSLARPWPAPEVQAALNWFEKDATTYGTMCVNYVSQQTEILSSLAEKELTPSLGTVQVNFTFPARFGTGPIYRSWPASKPRPF